MVALTDVMVAVGVVPADFKRVLSSNLWAIWSNSGQRMLKKYYLSFHRDELKIKSVLAKKRGIKSSFLFCVQTQCVKL